MTTLTATPAIRVLHLEDSKLDHELVKFALRRDGLNFELTRVETLEDFRREVVRGGFDAVLADYHLPDFTALDAWAIFREQPDPPPFIILSGAIGEEAAVDAIRRGMADYVLKDSMSRLQHAVLRAIEMHQTRRAREHADAELADSERRLAALTDHLQASIEAERAAIAREVHDDIGGALAALKLNLAWIGRQEITPNAREHLEAAMDMVNHALGASQRIMKNLRPAILDQGLRAAIEWLVQGFERRSGVPAHLQVDLGPQGEDTIGAELRQVVFRTAQEALTNVSKHANAGRVTVDLSGRGGVLTLEVTDDGAGFDVNGPDKPDSFGLRGLRERARTVGGWIDLSSGKGGTSVILSVPLGESVADDDETEGGAAQAVTEGGNDDQGRAV